MKTTEQILKYIECLIASFEKLEKEHFVDSASIGRQVNLLKDIKKFTKADDENNRTDS